jgi:hypothetical protein
VFYVTFSKDNGEYITDKSIEEMVQAQADGMYVVARIPMNSILRGCPQADTMSWGEGQIAFVGVTTNLTLISAVWTKEMNKWTVDFYGLST